jgi:putative MATE family efflux protein
LNTKSPTNREHITSGSLRKAIWKIALPTYGAFLTHDLMGTVDMLFVGRLGAGAVAAVAISGAVFGIIMMLSQGITSGTTALVANAVGRGDRSTANLVVGQSVLLASVVGVGIALIGVPIAAPALRIMGANEEVVGLGTGYFQITTAGALLMVLTMALGSSLRGTGDARTPFRAMVTGNIVNAILDPIFIFGWLGVPAMGVAGSAWATLIGRAIGASIQIHAYTTGRTYFNLTARHFIPEFSTMGKVLKIGVFASLRGLLGNIAMISLMRLVALYGTTAVAAFGIGMRLRMFIMGPSMGFGTAAATLVGQNLGAGNTERARKAGWLAVGTCSFVILGFSLVFWFFAEPIVSVFNTDPDVIATGATFMRWFTASSVFMSTGMVLGIAMSGAGDTVSPMVITGIAQVSLALPIAYFLSRAWGSVDGIWAAIAAGNLFEGLLFIGAFQLGRWVSAGTRIREAAHAEI